jgi:hypothetical protein
MHAQSTERECPSIYPDDTSSSSGSGSDACGKENGLLEFLQCELEYACVVDPNHEFRVALSVCVEEHCVTSAPTGVPTWAPTAEPTCPSSDVIPISDRMGLHVKLFDETTCLANLAYGDRWRHERANTLPHFLEGKQYLLDDHVSPGRDLCEDGLEDTTRSFAGLAMCYTGERVSCKVKPELFLRDAAMVVQVTLTLTLTPTLNP